MNQYFSDQLQFLQERAAGSELAFRREALEIFRAYGLPQRKQDPWKYVDNSALLNLPLGPEKMQDGEIQQGKIQEREIPRGNSPGAIEFHNGLAECHDWLRPLDMQNENPARWFLDRTNLLAEENSYSLINAFSFSQAYQLRLAAGTLRLCFGGCQSYQAPRLYIEIPAASQVSLLLDSHKLAASVYWNPYFHITLGENASLTLLERGPRLHDDSQHVRSVTLRGQVAAGAKVSSAVFYWSTALAIHDVRFCICGEGADIQVRGICFGEGRSRYHLRCENQHLAPNSQSQCQYKNVLFDKAVSEFYGIIHAGSNGVGTDAVQQNQNLLLSNEARAIARPQLEILVDDLKCGHGSSTGSIDAEELFYMCSRGLSQSEAMRLAVEGFVEEVSTYFDRALLDILGIEECLHALLEKRNR